jgi:hypothetical protein
MSTGHFDVDVLVAEAMRLREAIVTARAVLRGESQARPQGWSVADKTWAATMSILHDALSSTPATQKEVERVRVMELLLGNIAAEITADGWDDILPRVRVMKRVVLAFKRAVDTEWNMDTYPDSLTRRRATEQAMVEAKQELATYPRGAKG